MHMSAVLFQGIIHHLHYNLMLAFILLALEKLLANPRILFFGLFLSRRPGQSHRLYLAILSLNQPLRSRANKESLPALHGKDIRRWIALPQPPENATDVKRIHRRGRFIAPVGGRG